MRTTLIAICLLWATAALAEAPGFIPVQGFLTDADGTPIDGSVPVHFSLYGVPTGGVALWQETQTVTPQNGYFTAFLGFAEPIDLLFFVEHPNVWLAIAVDQDAEMQRVFLGSVPFAAYAEHCGTVPTHSHDISQLKDVAKAGQLCPANTIVNGIDANGNLLCQDPATGPTNFALSGQWCPPSHVMTGIDASGYPVCTPANASGNFALAGQSCYSDEVVTGIDGSGNLVCDEVSGAGGVSGSGYSKRLALWKSSSELEDSIVTESSGKIGINDTSPSQTLDVNGNLRVSGEIHWGGNKFSSSSCLVVGGSSCSSACSAHGMSCYKAFRIDGESTSDSCSQSGFKFCCCKD